MSNDLSEVHEFIRVIPPFDTLSEAQISQLTRNIYIQYVATHLSLPPEGDKKAVLYFIRKGALAYYGNDNELLSKYGEGDLCSVFLLPDENVKISVVTEEDTLLYCIGREELLEVITQSEEADAFFAQTAAQRLKKRMQKFSDDAVVSSTLMNTQLEHVYHTPAATIDMKLNIQQTAQQMTEQGYSCLVVTKQGEMVGIVTDKDIRTRCVGEGLDPLMPVSDIMSRDVLTLDTNDSAYDALIVMTSRNIHHLPVMSNGRLAGMVTVTDLMNHEGNNAVNISSLVSKANKISELTEISKMLPKLQIRMSKLGTTSDHVGKSISAITMAFTVRLIKMAENLLGPPPVPYAWLAAGSQARLEQFAHSDQDNAMIISDQLQPQDAYWYQDLATFVCDGLAACGFIYCPGDIMATNSKWRQTQAVWHKYFHKWVVNPSPQALLNSNVFFDLTTVHGDSSLLNEVRDKMLEKTKNNSLFIAHLSRNALAHRPPLGFFRGFVLVENGDNEKVLDLKHNGIAPIVDLARIYALQQGVTAVNTLARLRAVAGTPALTKSMARSLIDAFEFLGYLRLSHQARLLSSGKKPDNYLPPKTISRLEREHLKDVFKVIKTLQSNRQVAY